MYLRELVIKNSGPIRDLHAEFQFGDDDRPIPHVIVGRNGTGKTNLLSLIADALMEGAAGSFHDILPSASGLSRNFFRIIGGKTLTYGQQGGFAIFRFGHEGEELLYRENTGNITSAQAQEMVPPTLTAGADWPTRENRKAFNINADLARTIYTDGIYVFFPSSRSEHPFWLNPNVIIEDVYDQEDKKIDLLNR
jgi:hypothetical protein